MKEKEERDQLMTPPEPPKPPSKFLILFSQPHCPHLGVRCLWRAVHLNNSKFFIGVVITVLLIFFLLSPCPSADRKGRKSHSSSDKEFVASF
jgi:hypothetical protein